MTNTFTLILAIANLITGILWCIKYLIFIPSLTKRLIQKKNQQHVYAYIDKHSKHNWIENCASFFPVLLLVFIVRSFIFEPFRIPSGSMMPTLLIGDFILVNKFIYGIKNPITQTTIFEIDHPKRGDVVVFKYPLDPSIDYIKRVIGLPGDYVSYNLFNKSLTIKPSCTIGKNCTAVLPITYSELKLSDFIQIFQSTDYSKNSSYFMQIPPNEEIIKGIRLMQRKESLGSTTYNILTLPISEQQDQLIIYYQQSNSSLLEWVVPQGKYFMMGDNRDNSADSRYWGFVPEKNLVGQAIAIWLSFDKQTGKWPATLRLNRIGSIQ